MAAVKSHLVLASRSPFRSALLANAGLTFDAVQSDVAERDVEAPLLKAELPAEDIAQVLAEAKALDVFQREYANDPQAIIIGCDQTLSCEGQLYHKPETMDLARRNLLKLSGNDHQLCSAISLVRNGEVIWRHVSIAIMTMRPLSPQFIGRYLAKIGDDALSSVGCYQIEGVGIQLFEKIDGDHFTIVGLPMVPLLNKLRQLGAIDG